MYMMPDRLIAHSIYAYRSSAFCLLLYTLDWVLFVKVYRLCSKFGSLITTGKITGGMDLGRVAELLENTRAFYDSEMIAQLVNGMLEQSGGMTVGRVTGGQVDNVIRQLKAAGVRLA